jgi:uncharacterized membrane protein
MGYRLVTRLQAAIICLLGVGFLMVLQRWSFDAYHYGLMSIMGLTLLNIAVGNLPREASPRRAVLLLLLFLALVAVVFGVGIVLVPYLAQLGR